MPQPAGDGRLWAAALGISLLFNALLLLGFVTLAPFRLIRAEELPQAKPQERYLSMVPERGEADPAVGPTATGTPKEARKPERPPFARTSPDQAAEAPENPQFIGERDTLATSDRPPDPTADPLPSQKGIEPRDNEVETTESRYRDGELGADGAEASAETPPTPAPPEPMVAEPQAPSPPPAGTRGETTNHPGESAESTVPPQREKLAAGPNPVDVEVPEAKPADEPKPPGNERMPEGRPDATAGPGAAELPPAPPQPVTPRPKPKPPIVKSSTPGFRGNQHKTQIRGSISRTGKSALDVGNTALGRYQAQLSRAVEQEWQRACVRNRDLILPGFLTVRFVVEQSGKVRTVEFLEDITGGQVQKGFTLGAIREAKIPAMPADLKKELGDDPLELIYNFYF